MRLQLHHNAAARPPGISHRTLDAVILAAIFVVSGALLMSVGPAFAVEPGTPPCTSMLQYGSDVAPDPAINVQGASGKVVSVPDPAHEGEMIDQVQITWDPGLAEKGVECIWISSKPAGETQFRTEADTMVAADATSYSVTPLGTPGQYCLPHHPALATGTSRTHRHLRRR